MHPILKTVVLILSIVGTSAVITYSIEKKRRKRQKEINSKEK